MSFKIGIHGAQQDIEIDDLRRLWKFADQGGFDFISVWDHFYEAPPIDGNSPVFEAIALMSALASETENVRIGCHVLCMTYRNPGLLANSLMTIDHLSKGRLEVGLGAGWQVPEHEAYGFSFDSPAQRSDRLEEGIKIIRSMFTKDTTNFSGNYYKFSDAKLYPRPVQENIPIVVGGRGEKRTLPAAARLADGWNVPYVTSKEFLRLNTILDELCRIENREPDSLHRSVNLHMKMSATETNEYIGVEISDLANGNLTGGPSQAIKIINEYRDSGAERVSIAVRPPIDWEALEAFTQEVIPAFK